MEEPQEKTALLEGTGVRKSELTISVSTALRVATVVLTVLVMPCIFRLTGTGGRMNIDGVTDEVRVQKLTPGSSQCDKSGKCKEIVDWWGRYQSSSGWSTMPWNEDGAIPWANFNDIGWTCIWLPFLIKTMCFGEGRQGDKPALEVATVCLVLVAVVILCVSGGGLISESMKGSRILQDKDEDFVGCSKHAAMWATSQFMSNGIFSCLICAFSCCICAMGALAIAAGGR